MAAVLTPAVIARLEVTPDPKNETEFRMALVKLLRARGWLVTFNQARPAKNRYITSGTPGYPDLTCVRPQVLADPSPHRLRSQQIPLPPVIRTVDDDHQTLHHELVFLECKMVGKHASAEQRMWLNGLAGVGGNVRAWEVNVGHWPRLVDLARDGIVAAERADPDPACEVCHLREPWCVCDLRAKHERRVEKSMNQSEVQGE